MKNSEDYYKKFSNSISELKKRNSNSVLRLKVEKTLGKNFPDFMKSGPYFVFSRNIITPNNELRFFLDTVKNEEFNFLFFEYYDKFVTKNKDKYHLCNIHSSDGKNKIKKTIINFNKNEGKNLREIKLKDSPQFLVDLHHSLLSKKYPEIDFNNKIVNITDWFNSTRILEEYYFHYLSLFVCHGILFENFLWNNEEEKKFLIKKFKPSFLRVKEVFGVEPLIVPLLPRELEEDETWLSYDYSIIKNNVRF